MRNEEKKKRFKRLLVALVVIASAAATVFLGYEVFNRSVISKIEASVENAGCTDPDKITKFAKEKNLKYFTFKSEVFERELKNKFFCVGKVKSSLSYPDKLKLEVVGRAPVLIVASINTTLETNPVVTLPDNFKIATQSSMAAQPLEVIDNLLKGMNEASESGYFLVDQEGVVFESLMGTANFPKLQIIGAQIKVGGKIENDLIGKVQEITTGLQNINAPTDNLIALGDKLIVNSQPRIIFALNKRLDYQIASLQLILAQAKMNSGPKDSGSGNIESIDLRFNKPVVVYSKTKK